LLSENEPYVKTFVSLLYCTARPSYTVHTVTRTNFMEELKKKTVYVSLALEHGICCLLSCDLYIYVQCCSAGAARSRSCNSMRLRSDKWYQKWLGIEKLHKMEQFKTHSVHIFSNLNHTESIEKDSFILCLNFSVVPYKNFALLYSRVSAGAGTEST
jgi:hypothetical protein